MVPRKKIYIAGPLTTGCAPVNVRVAMDAHLTLAAHGYAPFCPHFSWFVDPVGEQLPYESWMEIDFAFVTVCDAVLRLPGESPGADREVRLATELGIPVYHSLDELLANV